METRFNVGDKVRMKNNEGNYALPIYYPDCTVIGEVVKILHTNMLLVNWGEDSGTSGNHTWLVGESYVVKVEE